MYDAVRSPPRLVLADIPRSIHPAVLGLREQNSDLRNTGEEIMIDRTKTAQAMYTYGGSFVRAIAQAWMLADSENRARVEAAFAPEFDKYEKIAGEQS